MYSAVRLTIFALLSAIEEDLRHLAAEEMIGSPSPIELLSEPLYSQALQRYKRDFDEADAPESIGPLLSYIDFGEVVQFVNRNRANYSTAISAPFRELTDDLLRLVPIRNRIAHTRPLDYNDLATVTAVIDRMITTPPLQWRNLRDTKARLASDPGYVFSLTLPSEEDPHAYKHNLPLPDFEDTGFLGRVRQRSELLKLCLGPYPVISVVGDGAVGKTSLALAAAYDLLDRPDNPFDAIVWSTAKATRLTPTEIYNIEGAIRDSLGMLQAIAEELAGSGGADPLDEVLAYLEEFKILLILDNVETVLDDRLREFLGRLPAGSKVLITSRVGIGAFEAPTKLGPMEEGEAVQLLRSLAQLRGVDALQRSPYATLAGYCRRMYMSPGFIKWFVSAVGTGVRPAKVLDNTNVLLDFCMTNVYEHLNPDAQEMLWDLLVLGTAYSVAELAFITHRDARSLESVLQELLRTNMVSIPSAGKGATPESTFRLSDLAREFLSRHHPVPLDHQRRILAAKRQLIATQERLKAELRLNPYAASTINVRTRSDLLVARLLSEGLESVRRGLIEQGLERIEEARRRAPDFYEVFRVLGFVLATSGDLIGARDAYETAVSLEPKSAPLRMFYSGFLMRFLDECEEARTQLEIAMKMDPTAVPVKVELARCHLIYRDFSAARGLLDDLLTTERLAAWQRRKIYDLHLQWFTRQAEFLLSDHDPRGSLHLLRELRRAFEACPTELLDATMRQRLGKAEVTARGCAGRLEDLSEREEAATIRAWLIQESGESTGSASSDTPIWSAGARLLGERVGTIKVWSPERRYGWIRSEGEEFFFHENDLVTGVIPSQLEKGQRVTFSIREAPKGPRAASVDAI